MLPMSLGSPPISPEKPDEVASPSRTSPAFAKLLHALVVTGLALFIIHAACFHVTCVDTGFHVRTGQAVWSLRGIPDRNLFSFTMPDQPWLLHQWLPGLLYYGIDGLAGIQGLIFFNAFMAGLLFMIVFVSARREAGDTVLAAWVVTSGVMLARVRFFIRPYMFSALFLALLFWLLRHRPMSRIRRMLIPLLFILWANTHAGVIYGGVLMAAFWTGTLVQWRVARGRKDLQGGARALRETLDLSVIGAISLVGSLVSVQVINPSGVKVLLLPLVYSLDPFWSDLIAEFHPPAGRDRWGLVAFLIVLVVLQSRAWRRVDWRLAVTSLGFGALAFMSQRSLLDFSIVVVPHLAGLLGATRLPCITTGRLAVRALGLVLVWVALSVAFILPDPVYRFGMGVYEPYYPMGVYRFIRDKVPSQRMYNDMRYGGGILWFLYPRFKPFVDGRCEAYSKSFWRDEVVPASLGVGWEGVFDRYGVEAALTPAPGQVPGRSLAQALRGESNWALVAFDDHTLLFLKRTETNATVIRDWEYTCLWPGEMTEVTSSTAGTIEAEARRAMAVPAPNRFARTALARSLKHQSRFGEAADLYASLVSEGQAADQYWRDYSFCLFMAGRGPELRRTLDRMQKEKRDAAYAHYLEHFLALKEGDVEGARRYLKQAIRESDESYLREALQSLPDGGNHEP